MIYSSSSDSAIVFYLFMADHKCYMPSVAYPQMAMNMEMVMNQFGSEIDSSTFLKNLHTATTDYSVGNFLGCKNQQVLDHHHQQNPTNLSDQDLPPHSNHQLMMVNGFNETKKRKANMEDAFSMAATNSGLAVEEKCLKKNSLVKGNNHRSRKISDKQDRKEDVVHVRARRGQATDSHSLAERVRREKINNKLRCLQELVPGCTKTMGMTMMLDEIISYVHSLQNQIEFLSTELAAACSYQSNAYIKAIKNLETFQQDPQDMEKLRAQSLPFYMV